MTPAPASLGPEDRLGLMLCLAVIFHTIAILGVVFTPEEQPAPRYRSMDIVLVQRASETADDDAALLAQANLQGGGDLAEDVAPSAPLPIPLSGPQPEPATESVESEPTSEVESPGEAADRATAEEVITQPDADAALTATDAPQDPAPEPNQPSATALLASSLRMAALSAEVRRKLETKAKRPKRTFISANTREYKYAAYMEAWRRKVERVGNLNYPEQARKRKIFGQLLLDVALNPDGSINQITVRRSSGQKILDDAATKIVELAAPYAPFPDNIGQDTDILHITRTWQFLDKRGFR